MPKIDNDSIFGVPLTTTGVPQKSILRTFFIVHLLIRKAVFKRVELRCLLTILFCTTSDLNQFWKFSTMLKTYEAGSQTIN